MRGFRELDRILRGGPRPDGTAASLGPLIVADIALAAVYGVCMGFFGVFGRAEPDFRFVLADALKVPLLFVMTLVVTFPSLYVFNALVGSRLGPTDLARLMAAALGVLVAVLAAFGPIVAFFSVTTTSYPFIVLLNVAVFTLAAGFAISFLMRTVEHLTTPVPRVEEPAPAPAPEEEWAPPAGERPAPLPRAVPVPKPDSRVRAVFIGWLVVFALVGVQMSWVLRPFIGTPDREFAWFRPRGGSFFEGVARALRTLLG